MCQCKREPKRIARTEKNCDHIKTVFTDGTWVINYLPGRRT